MSVFPNLITVVPGSILIENFIPGKKYKELISIYNTSKTPISLKLSPNDKTKLQSSESFIRLSSGQCCQVTITIQDNVKYRRKVPTSRKLFLFLRGELIEEKYEVNLLYKQEINRFVTRLNQRKKFIEQHNQQLSLHSPNNLSTNYKYWEATEYFKDNTSMTKLNTYNSNDENNYINIEQELIPEKTNNFMIFSTEEDELNLLKNEINSLKNKLLAIQLMQEKYENNNKKKGYDSRDLYKSHINVFFFGEKLDEIESNEKFKKDEEIQKMTEENQKKILVVENSMMAYRIKTLEDKLGLIYNEEEKLNSENVANSNSNEQLGYEEMEGNEDDGAEEAVNNEFEDIKEEAIEE